jgi:Tol biopolymer transport system component
MDLNTRTSNDKRRLNLFVYVFLNTLLCAILLVACNPHPRYENVEGITFIAPLGDPPIDYIEWSPVNQNEILITATYLRPGPTEIYILNISSLEKNVLVKAERDGVWAETWLPDGGSVVVVVNADNTDFVDAGYWTISTSDKSREFLRESDAPVWSPDGKTIALNVVGQNQDPDARKIEVRLLDVVTNKEEAIFSNVGPQRLFELSWSPDGQKLAYSLGDYDSSNIYIIDIKTRAITQLTKTETNDSPVWSPNGDMIAYNKTTGGIKSSLHLIRPDGSCDIEIPELNDARSPTWSPDGKKLAFVTLDGIYYLEIDKVFGEGGYQNLCNK